MSVIHVPRLDSPILHARHVTLQVGERRFITSRETLVRESGFFASLLSGRWESELLDGSYFVDADPGLFEHILRYLRRGVFPIFYDVQKGHDHPLYLALLEEARYFQIDRLQDWLGNKRYLQALTVKSSVVELDEKLKPKDFMATELSESAPTTLHIGWEKRNVYVCPRGIHVHRGKHEECGRKCRNLRHDTGFIYDKELSAKILRVKMDTELDSRACLANREVESETELAPGRSMG